MTPFIYRPACLINKGTIKRFVIRMNELFYFSFYWGWLIKSHLRIYRVSHEIWEWRERVSSLILEILCSIHFSTYFSMYESNNFFKSLLRKNVSLEMFKSLVLFQLFLKKISFSISLKNPSYSSIVNFFS